jgi:hypothetical protein
LLGAASLLNKAVWPNPPRLKTLNGSLKAGFTGPFSFSSELSSSFYSTQAAISAPKQLGVTPTIDLFSPPFACHTNPSRPPSSVPLFYSPCRPTPTATLARLDKLFYSRPTYAALSASPAPPGYKAPRRGASRSDGETFTPVQADPLVDRSQNGTQRRPVIFVRGPFSLASPHRPQSAPARCRGRRRPGLRC